MKSHLPLSPADKDLIAQLNRIVDRSRRQHDLPPLDAELSGFIREEPHKNRQMKSRLAQAFESDHPVSSSGETIN